MCILDDILASIEKAIEEADKEQQALDDASLNAVIDPRDEVLDLIKEVSEDENKFMISPELAEKFDKHFTSVGKPALEKMRAGFENDDDLNKLVTLVTAAIKHRIGDEIDNPALISAVGMAMSYTYGLITFDDKEESEKQ